MNAAAQKFEGKPTRASMYSPDLAAAVGYVVLEASHAEDALGELVVLRTGMDRFVEGWWTSGEQLIKALRGIRDVELEPIITLYEELCPRRNIVIHGHAIPLRGAAAVVMTRRKSLKRDAEPPSYAFDALNVPLLEELAADFRSLEAMTSDMISEVMGLA